MKEGVHKIVGMPGRIPMLAVFKVLVHNVCERGIFQESSADTIQRGSEAGDAHAKENASGLKYTTTFAERPQAVVSVGQMIKRAKKEDSIYGFRIPRQRTSVSDGRTRKRSVGLTARSFSCQFYVQRRDVD